MGPKNLTHLNYRIKTHATGEIIAVCFSVINYLSVEVSVFRGIWFDILLECRFVGHFDGQQDTFTF